MARLPMNVLPGQPRHTIQRGNNRQAVCYADMDYRFYLEALGSSAQQYGCLIHACMLMDSHVHLLLSPEAEVNPSRMMQSLGLRYVRYVNGCYQRTGALWQGFSRTLTP